MKKRQKVCERCGRWYMAGAANAKRCRPCRVIVHNERQRDYQARKQPPVGRVVLGPVPCQACRRPIIWNGYAWCEKSGGKHSHDLAIAA